MRLIDADEYIERKALRDTLYDADAITMSGVNILNQFPGADVVPVVRCKDCKYHEDEEIGMVYCPNIIGGWVAENWFCADGVRKEGVD